MPVPATGRSPRRLMTRTIAFGLSALVAAGLLTWTPAAVSGWNQGAAEGTLWQLLNGARTNNGLGPLQSHGTLVGLARWRSADMLNQNYFSHTIPGCGCLVYTYYDQNGLQYAWAGENIGWNAGHDDSYSPVAVHEAFMASAGHRVNVLDGRFTHGGVGAAAADGQDFLGYVQNTRMYTELFLQAQSAPAPPPPPAPAPKPPAPAPAPAPPPPAPAPGAGSGGGATAPAAQAAQAAEAEPEPEAKVMSVGALQRPRSTVGIDGVASVVAPAGRSSVAALVVRYAIDELDRAQGPGRGPAKGPAPVMVRAPMEVSAPASAAGGPLDGILQALLGFLFG